MSGILHMLDKIFSKKPLTSSEIADITEAIRLAEMQTSGEIRLHVEPTLKGNAIDRCKELFVQLKMNETKAQNGILFYLAYKSRNIAIWGDSAIHAHVQQEFWDNLCQEMIIDISSKGLSAALCAGIEKCGKKLKIHFPYQSDDTNELSNEISFGGDKNEI